MTVSTSITEIYNGLVNNYQFSVACFGENSTPVNTTAFCISRLNNRTASQINLLADIAYDMGDGDLARKFQIEAESLELYGNSPTPV